MLQLASCSVALVCVSLLKMRQAPARFSDPGRVFFLYYTYILYDMADVPIR